MSVRADLKQAVPTKPRVLAALGILGLFAVSAYAFNRFVLPVIPANIAPTVKKVVDVVDPTS